MRPKREIAQYEVWDNRNTVATFESASELADFCADHVYEDDWIVVGLDPSGYSVDSFTVADILGGILGRGK